MASDGVPTSDEMRDMLMDLKAREAVAKENQKFLCEFIEMYREFTCLWKYTCKNYRNRLVKHRAYAALVEKMKEVDPRADKNSVMRKINALRTAFRREYKKVRESMANAKVYGSKKYSPTLWYYDLLKFVVEEQDPTVPPPGVACLEWQEDHMDGNFEDDDEESKDQDFDNGGDAEYYNDSNIPLPSIKLEPLSPSSSRGCSPTVPTATSTSGPTINLEINSVYSEKDATTNNNNGGGNRNASPQETSAMNRLKRPFPKYQEVIPADLDRFASYVVTKLKRSSRKQSIIAEKVIAEVLMRANLGTLDETTTLTDTKPTTTIS